MNKQRKTALITGANKGLGLETARQLSELGIHVIVSARNEKKLLQVKALFEQQNIEADYLHLDITVPDDILNIKNYIQKHYGRLDILINNAGISLEKSATYMVNTSPDVTIDLIKEVYETNLFGTIMLTQALLPLLKKSEAGRIVNLNTELGSLALHADSNSPVYHVKKFAYNSSKTALNQFTIHLAEALEGTAVKVNSVSPGWVKTDMGTQYAPLEIPDGAKIIVKAAMLPEDGPNGCFFTHDRRAVGW